MKITNILSNFTGWVLVENDNGWRVSGPGDHTGHAVIEKHLDPKQRYWWLPQTKKGETPAVVEVTLDQAMELVEHGYKFEVVEYNTVKITNIKIANTTFVEARNGWKPDTSKGGSSRVWIVEKFLDRKKSYHNVEMVLPDNTLAVAELKLEDAIVLKSKGYTFDIVKEDEEMNETEGPKFYALQGKYGLVFALPSGFQHGFEAGEATTRNIKAGIGYIIFASLEGARRIAGFSRKTDDFDKLQVVEVDPIANKVIKVVEEPKQTKWRISWSGGESTPKWFKGNALGDWSLVTSKSEAREFDTLKNAERVVKILGLTGLYVTEDK
ncbi:hypothetical protein phiYS61_37 [Weissella phage phiYS61]|uniref:hypothetical protein n=1 Tax=Weissella phage phiYS61 TaxID=1161906 RepID=UPI000274E24C|nr:hypothetical protein phiYS61_37 [Weissella phage phiYS61]AFF27995.1 hypothetical protein phiYS61_37 [Weissella phage phiYS61]